LANDPTYIRNTVESLIRRAEGGDQGAAELLFGWLEKNPDTRSTIRGLDELALKIERMWAERLFGTDEVGKAALREEVAALKAGLLGPAPSALEKILANSVVIAHLSFQQASMVASGTAEGAGGREARERRLSLAQKRLIAAVKTWEQISGKKAAGLRPRVKIAIFEPLAPSE